MGRGRPAALHRWQRHFAGHRSRRLASSAMALLAHCPIAPRAASQQLPRLSQSALPALQGRQSTELPKPCPLPAQGLQSVRINQVGAGVGLSVRYQVVPLQQQERGVSAGPAHQNGHWCITHLSHPSIMMCISAPTLWEVVPPFEKAQSMQALCCYLHGALLGASRPPSPLPHFQASSMVRSCHCPLPHRPAKHKLFHSLRLPRCPPGAKC